MWLGIYKPKIVGKTIQDLAKKYGLKVMTYPQFMRLYELRRNYLISPIPLKRHLNEARIIVVPADISSKSSQMRLIQYFKDSDAKIYYTIPSIRGSLFHMLYMKRLALFEKKLGKERIGVAYYCRSMYDYLNEFLNIFDGYDLWATSCDVHDIIMIKKIVSTGKFDGIDITVSEKSMKARQELIHLLLSL